MEIKYDKCGRMLYNSEFHQKNGTRWSKEDTQYLIDWYNVISAEEMSFALERSIGTVMQKASYLRKLGKIKIPNKKRKGR